MTSARRRRLYAGGRPQRLARLLNRGQATLHSAGIWPKRLATLEVRGRRSGRLRSLPVVIADLDGERYLVAMLGEGAGWVANVRAAGGRAVLRHGRREPVLLEEVEPASGRRSCGATSRWQVARAHTSPSTGGRRSASSRRSRRSTRSFACVSALLTPDHFFACWERLGDSDRSVATRDREHSTVGAPRVSVVPQCGTVPRRGPGAAAPGPRPAATMRSRHRHYRVGTRSTLAGE